jgi:hypothetical protein
MKVTPATAKTANGIRSRVTGKIFEIGKVSEAGMIFLPVSGPEQAAQAFACPDDETAAMFKMPQTGSVWQFADFVFVEEEVAEAVVAEAVTLGVITTIKNPKGSYPEVYPNYVRAEYRKNESDKYASAVVNLYIGTEEEAKACIEALIAGKDWMQWPVHYTQISHWYGLS